MGKEILVKTRKQIDKLIEKVFIDPPDDSGDEQDISTIPDVSIRVDTSDEASTQFSPRTEDQFYIPNKHGIPTLKKVEVKINVDSDIEESSDTVYGQGTNPKPEDETYLSLLKGTTMTKAKVKIKEEDDEDEKDEIEVKVNKSPTQPNANLNPSFYGGDNPKAPR